MSNGHSCWTAPASKSPPDSRVIFPRLTLSIVNASSNFDRPTNFWSKKCEIVRCCAIVGKGHRASKTYLLVLRKSRTSSVSLVETYSYPAVICLCQSHNHSALIGLKTLISSNAVIKSKQRSDSIALRQAAIESNFGIELGVMGKVELGY